MNAPIETAGRHEESPQFTAGRTSSSHCPARPGIGNAQIASTNRNRLVHGGIRDRTGSVAARRECFLQRDIALPSSPARLRFVTYSRAPGVRGIWSGRFTRWT
jgi:hypothetical protein